jgi:hypothetical protein
MIMAVLESDRLNHVNPNWDEAYSCLVGHGLAVLRVTKSSPEGQVTVIWRQEPTPDEQMKANRLISGVVPTHSW